MQKPCNDAQNLTLIQRSFIPCWRFTGIYKIASGKVQVSFHTSVTSTSIFVPNVVIVPSGSREIGVLPDFIPWGPGYESVYYGINNARPICILKEHWALQSLKFCVNWANIEQDTAIQELKKLLTNVSIARNLLDTVSWHVQSLSICPNSTIHQNDHLHVIDHKFLWFIGW